MMMHDNDHDVEAYDDGIFVIEIRTRKFWILSS